MLNEIWKNRTQILEGITNIIIRDEFVEDVAKQRLEVCNNCELKGDKCLVVGTGPCCNECGCSLKLKLRSLSSHCGYPAGPKWQAVITEEEENKLNNFKK